MTESKKAEEALLDNERMARTIIDTALDAIIQVNEFGEVLEWNPQAEAILGWSRQEAMGRPLTDLYLAKGYRPRYPNLNKLLRQWGAGQRRGLGNGGAGQGRAQEHGGQWG